MPVLQGKKTVLAISALSLVAVAIAILIFWSEPRREVDLRLPVDARELAEERTAEIPDFGETLATHEYLSGRGGPARRLHEIALQQIEFAGRDGAACLRAAEQLNSFGDRDQMASVIAEIPDEPLRSFLGKEAESLNSLLVLCIGSGTASGESLARLTEAAALADIRLAELESR